MTQKEKTMLERIDMEAKMHIHAFCEIVPDQITGRKYAVVRKNCDGQIIHQYTNYYKPEQLEIAVYNFINGMWEAENKDKSKWHNAAYDKPSNNCNILLRVEKYKNPKNVVFICGYYSGYEYCDKKCEITHYDRVTHWIELP